MSTLINDLKQGELQTGGGDDSQMISEILQEMNESSGDMGGGNTMAPPPPSQPMMPQPTQIAGGHQVFQQEPYPNTHLGRQLDPNVNMAATDMMGGGYGQQDSYEEPLAEPVAKSWTDTIIEKVKDPLIVALLVLVVFSPILTNLLIRYVPRLYNPSVSMTFVWLGLVTKALLISILFFVIKMFV
jgi:hypothetical protein